MATITADLKCNFYSCDFETTTIRSQRYKDVGHTDIYLSMGVHLYDDKIVMSDKIENNLDDFFGKFFKMGENATLFFHNLQFDGDFIRKWLDRTGYCLVDDDEFKKTSRKVYSILENEKEPIWIKIKKKVRVGNNSRSVILYIRDSLKLFPLSVKKLANKITGPKLEFDYHLEPQDGNYPDVVYEYIKRDCDIVKHHLINYNTAHHIDKTRKYRIGGKTTLVKDTKPNGLTSATTSSTAERLFKYHYNKNIFRVEYDTDTFKRNFTIPVEQHKSLKPFYSGGITTFKPSILGKVMKIPNGRIYDVNSMYPSVMIEKLPYGELMNEPPSGDFATLLVIFIETASPKYNDVIPMMINWKKKYPLNESEYIDYANKRYIQELKNCRAFYYQDELFALEQLYNIKYRVLKRYYLNLRNHFSSFITKYYDKRKELKANGDTTELQYKLILNSLYGKFGQKIMYDKIYYSHKALKRNQEIVLNEKSFGKEHKNVYKVKTIRNPSSWRIENDITFASYVLEPQFEKKRGRHIGVAGYITSLARIKLINAVAKNPYIVLYCDTDSIITSGDAIGIDINETKLGSWKMEHTFDTIAIGGAKFYRCDENGKNVKSGASGISSSKLDDVLKSINDYVEYDRVFADAKLIKKKDGYGTILVDTSYTLKKRGN